MLSTTIKEATKIPHQQVEKKVIYLIRNIRNEADYADFLKHFYAYFFAVEHAIAPFINTDILPDLSTRRNSSYLKNDIEALGSSMDELPLAIAPPINNTLEAIGALYVLEGSILGGPYIVQMLQKLGLKTGFTFFSGYGEASAKKWADFTDILNQIAKSETEEQQLLATAHQTFAKFADVFPNANITN